MSKTKEPPDFIGKLRAETTAIKFSHTKFGVRRSLTPDQLNAAALTFGAKAQYLSAAKRLLDTRHEAFRACTEIIAQARAFWVSMTVPYPEPGIRLIRRDRLSTLQQRMDDFQVELEAGRKKLREYYGELRRMAKDRLGDLFNADDYPADISETFTIEWEPVPIGAPEHLRVLNPELYAAQEAKVAARFAEAIRQAEEDFAAELRNLVGHLLEKLAPDESGKPKTFRDSTVTNLTEFFGKFKALAVTGSNPNLEQLVNQAEAVITNTNADALRKDKTLREQLNEALSPMVSALDGMVTTKPKRKIVLEDDGTGSTDGDGDREFNTNYEAA